MNKYLNKMIEVKIDRPLGSKHPQYDLIYPVNYGYIPGTKAKDGEPIDVYILGIFEPIETFKGRVIAIIRRKDDKEDKLVAAKTMNSYSKTQIKALTEFQERFFETEIICCNRKEERPQIRVTVLGLARRDNQVLVTKGYDAIKDIYFYRFLGGGVEFQEKCKDTLEREFMEEIGAKIKLSNYLCKIENIFSFEGEKRHELLLIYEIKLDEKFYNKDEFLLIEDGAYEKAFWINKEDFLNGDKILYPKKVLKYL